MTEIPSDSRLTQILTRLENGARSQPKESELGAIDEGFTTIRADYYDAYDAAVLEGATHDEARRLASRQELDFRRSQADTMEKWLDEKADLVRGATQHIENPQKRTCLGGLFPLLVEHLPNGLPRFRSDVARVALTILGDEMNSGIAHKTVGVLYQTARTACNFVADGSFFSSAELAGKTTAQAHAMGVPLFLAPDARVIHGVAQAGFQPRRMINKGLQTLGEPVLFASITTE